MSRVFFTDRDLGRRFPAVLRAAGLEVQEHADHFAHDTPDADWLAEIGTRGWIVLTHDQRIRYRPNEIAAVRAAGIGLLVLFGKGTSAELAATFVNSLRRINAFLDTQDPPFIAKVHRPTPAELQRNPKAPGRIERWSS